MKTFDATGTFPDMKLLAEKIASISSSGENRGAGSAEIIRWLESQTYSYVQAGVERSQAQSFVSPDTSSYHYELAEQYKIGGDLLKALDSFSEGMSIAEKDKNESPWRFYLAASEILRSQKRLAEDADLWTRAIKNGRTGLNANTAKIRLAESLISNGKNEDARKILDSVDLFSYELGMLYEKIGECEKAIKTYTGSIDTFASYSALIRIFSQIKGKGKSDLADSLSSVMATARPRQTIRLVEEMKHENLGAGLLLNAARAAETLRDDDLQESFLSLSASSQASNSDKLIALEKLAFIERSRGNYEKAIELIDKALSLKLDDKDSKLSLDKLKGLKELFKNSQPPSRKTTAGEPVKRGLSRDYKAGNVNIRLYENGIVALMDGDNVKWEYDMGTREPYSSSPSRSSKLAPAILAGGSVYFTRDLDVLATTLSIAGGILYISDIREGILHAIDLESGKTRWKHADWSWISKVFPTASGVYVGNSMGDLSVLSLEDGRILKYVPHPSELETRNQELLPSMSFSEDKGLFTFNWLVQANDRPTNIASYSISLPNYEVALVKKEAPPRSSTDTRDKKPLKQAQVKSELDKALDEAVSDFLKSDPYHGPLIDKEIRIFEETKDIFSKCLKNDPDAKKELEKALTFEKYSLLHGLIAAGLVGRLSPDKSYSAILVKMIPETNSFEAKYIYGKALARIGDPSAIPALFPWLLDDFNQSSPEEAAPVVEALEALSGKSFGPLRAAWENWWAGSAKTSSIPQD